MNKQEDFDRQADDYSNCCFEEDDSLFAAFHFKEGAEFGYKYAVNKMEEWLSKHVKKYVCMICDDNATSVTYDDENLIKDLCKAMEE